ncbi:MAG: hypothetical protein JW837_15945 [Sedimentisphaerales bacterium]|nr:hypothetical protein [Sedimentisphaerales bacterium]
MNELLEKICFPGQIDIEGWMDILILVVIAVIYGLGAILKIAKSRKEEEERTRGQQLRRPQRRPPKSGRGLLEQIFAEVKKAAEEVRKETEDIPPSRKVAHPRPSQQAILQKYAEAQPVSQIPSIAGPATPATEPKVTNAITLPDLNFQELPSLSTNILGLPEQMEFMSSETARRTSLGDLLWDYKDPEELKRAILHYEILGKPLALRDLDEGIIGL